MLYVHFQITHPKTDEQRQRLQEACKDILLFKNLDPVSEPVHGVACDPVFSQTQLEAGGLSRAPMHIYLHTHT